MSPPTEPPRSFTDHAERTVPWLFDHLQTPKRLCSITTNVCVFFGLVLMVVPIESISELVGVKLHAVMPWWGYLLVALLAAALAFAGETYCSNEQERIRRNGSACYVEDCENREREPPASASASAGPGASASADAPPLAPAGLAAGSNSE